MIKKVVFIFALMCFASPSLGQTPWFGPLLKEIGKQAVKGASTEAGKAAVDYFKDLFNKDKEIAQKKKNPQLEGGELKGKERLWVISPVGNLNKADIDEIARVLKSIDHNRHQRIDQKVTTTQAVNVAGSGNVTNVIGDRDNVTNINIAHLDQSRESRELMDRSFSVIEQQNKKYLEATLAFQNKTLEDLNKKLSKLYSQKIGGTDEEVNKWALDTIERARETRTNLKNADKLREEYEKELSTNVVGKVYGLFDYIFTTVDSKLAAFQQLKPKVKYEKDDKFVLFGEESTPTVSYTFRTVVFENGNRILFIVTPGKLKQGLISTCPSLTMKEIVGRNTMQEFSVVANYGLHSLTIVSPETTFMAKKAPKKMEYPTTGKEILTQELKNKFNTAFQELFEIAYTRQ